MTEHHRAITLFQRTPEAAERYSWAFRNAELAIFKADYVPADRIFTEPGFDALYLDLAAAQRWKLPPKTDTVQVVKTRPEDQRSGLPPYVLVGLELSPGNMGSDDAKMRAWARATLDALDSRDAKTIARLKVSMADVPGRKIHPDHAAQVFSDVERERPERARLKHEIAILAAAILAEKLDLIDGAHEIERKRIQLDDETYEPLQGIRAFADQTVEYPRHPEQRALWADEALLRFDERYVPYIAAERAGVITDLKTIVRDFGESTA